MKLKVDKNSLLKAVEKHAKTVVDKMIDKFYDTGLKLVEDARRNGEYLNHTNNLRSSLGIAVALNGQIIRENFKQVGDGDKDNGSEGLKAAKDLINEIKDDYKDRLILVVVAGEYYAGYVESKGKDVLSGSAGNGKLRKILSSK